MKIPGEYFSWNFLSREWWIKEEFVIIRASIDWHFGVG